jgi:hypothetical protein
MSHLRNTTLGILQADLSNAGKNSRYSQGQPYAITSALKGKVVPVLN